MRESLFELCSNFIENRNVVRDAFPWESTYIYPVCAAIHMNKRRKANEEQLRYCRDILKEKTGIFSNFRSNAKLAMIAMLAVDDNPEGKMDRALQVYDSLKQYFWSSQYLPVASIVIADAVELSQYSTIAARTRHIYDLMKNEHPFLTSGEDSVFAAMLALSNLTDEQVVERTERCYRLLKSEFFTSNAVQALSFVLALSDGKEQDNCSATIELFRGLKAKGYKYGTNYELATLGVLATLPAERSAVMADIMEVDDFLSKQKGYGVFSIGRKQRIMHAGMIVTSDYTGASETMKNVAIGSTISMVAAQQAAMCAAVAAASAAANCDGN